MSDGLIERVERDGPRVRAVGEAAAQRRELPEGGEECSREQRGCGEQRAGLAELGTEDPGDDGDRQWTDNQNDAG